MKTPSQLQLTKQDGNWRHTVALTKPICSDVQLSVLEMFSQAWCGSSRIFLPTLLLRWCYFLPCPSLVFDPSRLTGVEFKSESLQEMVSHRWLDGFAFLWDKQWRTDWSFIPVITQMERLLDLTNCEEWPNLKALMGLNALNLVHENWDWSKVWSKARPWRVFLFLENQRC